MKVILNETRLELIMIIRYPFSLLIGVLSRIVIFYGILVLAKSVLPFEDISVGSSEYAYKSFLLVGFILWSYASMVTYSISSLISYERITGTLQQKFISSSSPIIILFGHSLGNLLIATLKNIVIITFLVIFANIKIYIPASFFLILGFTLLGLYGFAFLLAGLNLVVRSVEGLVVSFLDFFFLFFCGVITPIEKLPSFIQNIGNSIPLTKGIKLLRATMLDAQPLSLFIYNGELLNLFLTSLCYLFLGVVIYNMAERFARVRGELGYF